MPIISVIVPVYNTEKYLRRCVDSILCQKFTDFVLILVDDGRQDGSGMICDDYALQDSRVQVIHQKNQGVSSARNNGVSASKGKYISFIDSDDWVAPEYLSRMWGSIERYKGDICTAQILRVNNNVVVHPTVSEQIMVLSGPKALQYLGLENTERFRSVCSKLLRRELALRFPLPPMRKWSEDTAVVYKWLHYSNIVVIMNDKEYFYFENADGITNDNDPKARLGEIETLEEQLSFFDSNNYTRVYEKFMKSYLWNLCWQFRSAPREEKEFKQEIRQKLRHAVKESKAKCFLENRDYLESYEVLYPRTMWLYWTFFAIIKKLSS